MAHYRRTIVPVHRDTLIQSASAKAAGKPAKELTRGVTGGYAWTIYFQTHSGHSSYSVSSTRAVISVRKASGNAELRLEDVPNYVLADILLSQSLSHSLVFDGGK